MKIQFGTKTWDFISSFSDFNLSNVKEYMRSQSAVDDILKKQNDILIEMGTLIPEGVNTQQDIELAILEGRMAENYEGQIYVLESDMDELQEQLRVKRTELLTSLCKGNKKKFVHFCENTKGVDYGLIREAVKAILNKLGHFSDYWRDCPMVSSFKIRKPWSIFRTTYKLHDMDRNTLIRDHLANQQLKLAFSYEEELVKEEAWDNISLFVATITRPLFQEFEFSFSKNSFINSKAVVSIKHADRLEYYMEKLEKSWKKRSVIFEKLPLAVAIGIIKYYWQKKKELEQEYSKIHKSSSDIKTDIYKKYVAIFETESTILMLNEASSYTVDEIWLFSVDTFALEVKKYNLKAKAEYKEMEAEQKLLDARNGN